MMSQRDKHAEMFADYMIEAMTRTGLRQADIARATKLSRQTISQLVGKKPHALTGKLLLPERETVEAIARAFGDDPSVARKAAGYSDTTPDAEPYETVEETLRAAFFFDDKGLSDEGINQLRPFMEMLDREIDRLAAQAAMPRKRIPFEGEPSEFRLLSIEEVAAEEKLPLRKVSGKA